MVVICLLGYNPRASRVRGKERGRQQWEMWVSEIEWMWNLVTSLLLSGARIIIIERFAKSVISGCWVDGGVGKRCSVDVSFCLRWQDRRCWMTVSWPATLCTRSDYRWPTGQLMVWYKDWPNDWLVFRLGALAKSPAIQLPSVIVSSASNATKAFFSSSVTVSSVPAIRSALCLPSVTATSVRATT